jgi:hypothetical protein
MPPPPAHKEISTEVQLFVIEGQKAERETILKIVERMLDDRDEKLEYLGEKIEGISEKINASNMMQAESTGVLKFLKWAIPTSIALLGVVQVVFKYLRP